MATRTQSGEPAGLKTKNRKAATPAKKRSAGTPRKRPSPAATPREATAAKKAGGAKGLLRAGLQALGNVHNDVVKRQSHVIESLLGVRAAEELKARAFPGLDSFGFRKFEDVFDQRVATALERLGMPSGEEIEALREEVRQLRAQLDSLQGVRRSSSKR